MSSVRRDPNCYLLITVTAYENGYSVFCPPELDFSDWCEHSLWLATEPSDPEWHKISDYPDDYILEYISPDSAPERVFSQRVYGITVRDVPVGIARGDEPVTSSIGWEMDNSGVSDVLNEFRADLIAIATPMIEAISTPPRDKWHKNAQLSKTVSFLTAWHYRCFEVQYPEASEWECETILLGRVDLKTAAIIPLDV